MDQEQMTAVAQEFMASGIIIEKAYIWGSWPRSSKRRYWLSTDVQKLTRADANHQYRICSNSKAALDALNNTTKSTVV